MKEIAGTLLLTQDGCVVLHRRDSKAPTNPDKLALFGGSIEPGELPPDAAKRELGEETSLKIAELVFEHVADKDFSDDRKFYLYKTIVPTTTFDVFEGVGSEVFAIDEALERNDLTDSARYTLEQITGDSKE